MLLGGALGNVIDRAARGAVTDYIKLPHWPAFNLADAAITVGVVVLLVVVERDARRARARGAGRAGGGARRWSSWSRLRPPASGSTRSSPRRSARAAARSG